MLHYQLPTKPSASRVHVWRKLKRLGAMLWYDSVWVLPDTPRTREHFQWLAVEIVEMKGSAFVWSGEPLQPGQGERLIETFSERTDAAYRTILTEAKRGTRNLAALTQKYQQATQTDFFGSPLADKARAALTSARKGRRS